jgi:PAS domain S-box-containing protein
MAGHTGLVAAIYLGAVVLALTISVVLFRNREKKGSFWLSLASFSSAVWAGGLFLSTAPWDWLALAGIRGLYLGVGVGLPAMLLFALEYTGRERFVQPMLFWALAIHPILLVGFVFINPGGLFFIELDPSSPVGVEQTWGVAFWIHSMYGYVLSLSISVLILELVVRANRTLYAGQSILLAAGVFTPLPLNAVFLAEVVSFDTTPLGFIIMSTCFGVAIVRYDLINISPIAREKVIDNVRDGMIVVDTDDQIVESNPAAREIIGAGDNIVGQSVYDVFSIPAAISGYEKVTATVEPAEQTQSFGELYVKTESTPIYDDRDRHIGWLFLLQDVSEQVRRERDLEQQIEKLDQFASLVSHDLRNPINVARGYIQQTQATGDVEHLEKANEATERMEEIIDDALTLAREGQDVTDPVELSLGDIAHNAWENVDTKDATLTVTSEATIIADGDRLKRLFENLFRNSVEHGGGEDAPTSLDPSGLSVTVGTDDQNQTETTIVVADDGIGIPPEDRDQVFEDGYSTGEGGTGLGLTIVQQIANAHDWEISVTESESSGAQFEISGVGKPL